MTDDLTGRVALVTGATSDIGAATARALARRGADLVLHGHANAQRLEALRSELGRDGRRVATVQADLAEYEEVRRVALEGIPELRALREKIRARWQPPTAQTGRLHPTVARSNKAERRCLFRTPIAAWRGVETIP